jgi:hypothetical protein
MCAAVSGALDSVIKGCVDNAFDPVVCGEYVYARRHQVMGWG